MTMLIIPKTAEGLMKNLINPSTLTGIILFLPFTFGAFKQN